MTFLDFIHSGDPNDDFLIYSDKSYSRSDFIRLVEQKRANSIESKAKSVSIALEDPFDFLVCLAAFDGFASAIIIGETSADIPVSNKKTQWLIATSGTTGKAKIASHSFSDLFKKLSNQDEKNVWGLLYPPYSFAGLQVCLQAMVHSSKLLIPKTQSSLAESLEFFIQHKVTHLSATPTRWRLLLSFDRIKQLKLKQITLGGEAADKNTLEQLYTRFPESRITEVYASTEMGVVFKKSDKKPGFPITLLKSTNIKVSKESELLILDKDRWIESGDLISIEEDRFYVSGRKSSFINVGGHKVQPEKIEQKINHLNGVLASHISSRKNPICGELVVLEVVPNGSIEPAELKMQINDWSQENLSRFERPALIKLVKELSLSEMGKVIRFA